MTNVQSPRSTMRMKGDFHLDTCQAFGRERGRLEVVRGRAKSAHHPSYQLTYIPSPLNPVFTHPVPYPSIQPFPTHLVGRGRRAHARGVGVEEALGDGPAVDGDAEERLLVGVALGAEQVARDLDCVGWWVVG